jgi:hypothetical protein
MKTKIRIVLLILIAIFGTTYVVLRYKTKQLRLATVELKERNAKLSLLNTELEKATVKMNSMLANRRDRQKVADDNLSKMKALYARLVLAKEGKIQLSKKEIVKMQEEARQIALEEKTHAVNDSISRLTLAAYNAEIDSLKDVQISLSSR